MTKEEIQIAQAAYCVGKMWDEYEGTEDFDLLVGKRVQHLIELVRKSNPSLPSNLDEAEYAYAGTIPAIEYPELFNDEQLRNAFKAGAVWTAGQFQKIEGDLVDWYSTSDGKDYCCGVKTIDAFEVPEGFYIRKKQ